MKYNHYICQNDTVTMSFFKSKSNDRFPAMVERQNWKGILNALGERGAKGDGSVWLPFEKKGQTEPSPLAPC